MKSGASLRLKKSGPSRQFLAAPDPVLDIEDPDDEIEDEPLA